MAFAIRPAETMDWPLVRDLIEDAGLPATDLNEQRMADFLVAESPQGDILGAIGIETFGAAALLRSLVIGRASRQGGMGRALIERLEAGAASKGIRDLWLLTTDADVFFSRIGYVARPRTEAPEAIRNTDEFSSLCPDTAILMWRRIGS